MSQKLTTRQLFLAVVMTAILAGCSTDVRPPVGHMDTPRHHYENGLRFLDDNDLQRATQEFHLALEMDPDYGPALSGRGVVLAMRGDEDGAREFLDEGYSAAQDEEQELVSHISAIRSSAALAENGALSPGEAADWSEDAFVDGLDLIEDNPGLNDPALYYYMGDTYLQALDFASAETMYSRARDLGQGYEAKAEARWRMVQDIRRAAPQSSIGKRIALVESITRADMAALLVEELDIEQLFGSPSMAGASSSGFTPPGSSPSGTAADRVTDIWGHPLRADMERVINLGVRGLAPYEDGRFDPDAPMARAEVALVLEDIIVRATNTPSLATMFFGQQSPFADMRSDHPAFNAVMVCTTRGLMAGRAGSGNFDPTGGYSGAEAVLSINQLRVELDRL